MTLSLVQHTTANADGSMNLTLTLGASPTAGNILVFAYTSTGGGSPSPLTQTSGPTLTEVTTGQRVHASNGSYGYCAYRNVVGGDGTTIVFGAGGPRAGIFAEFSGAGGAGSPSYITTNNQQNSTTLALAPSPGAGEPVFAAFGTRLQEGGTFSANGDSTQVNGVVAESDYNSHGAILVYGEGNVTLGGTQGGTTQDDYWWGGIAFSWAPEATGGPSFGYILG